MQGHIQRQGDAWIVIIPDAIVNAAGLTEGSLVDISFDHTVMNTEIAKRRVYSLDELLAGVTPENLHGETEMGPAIGKEIDADDEA